ncbi:ParB-like partition protein [Salmonella phage SeKF_80]
MIYSGKNKPVRVQFKGASKLVSKSFETTEEVSSSTKEEQDAIIAELMAGQAKRLNEISHKGSAKERRRQARMEAEARATVETVTYHPQRPAPARRVEPQTTVTAAPVERKGSTVQRTVEVRTGQADFRNRVSMNFGGSCAITGHNVTQCLQAAHISPFADDKNNNTSNGILMSADLHLLFDNHLMSINPDTLTVHFKCNHPYSTLYEGNELKAHRVKLDVEALRIHWNLFKG